MKSFSLKRSAVAGAAALTLIGATLGVAGAQQTPSASPAPQPGAPSTQQRPAGPGTPGQTRPTPEQRQQQHPQFLASVASKLGVAPERLQQAMDQARQELSIPERGPGGPGGRGGRMGGPGGLDAAAQALGLSADQLRQELQGGRTLAQVAQARNVNPTTVANAMKAAANTKIDEAAAAGHIPADQVVTAKQQAAQRIDEMMNRQGPPARPTGQPGARRGPGGTAGSFSS